MATEVAFSTIAPRASSSPRSGVPWQEAIAIASAVAARLRCAIRSIDGRDPKPPATQIRDDRVGLVVAVPRRAHAPGPVDHRLVQIRCRNRHRVRQRRGHRPRDHTGPGGDLEDRVWWYGGQPARQVAGLRLETHGHQPRLVYVGHRSGEGSLRARCRHRPKPLQVTGAGGTRRRRCPPNGRALRPCAARASSSWGVRTPLRSRSHQGRP